MPKSVFKFRKVTLNIPIKIYDDLMARCKDNGTNTTSEIINLIRLGMDQQKAINLLPDIIQALANDRKTSKKSK